MTWHLGVAFLPENVHQADRPLASLRIGDDLPLHVVPVVHFPGGHDISFRRYDDESASSGASNWSSAVATWAPVNGFGTSRMRCALRLRRLATASSGVSVTTTTGSVASRESCRISSNSDSLMS